MPLSFPTTSCTETEPCPVGNFVAQLVTRLQQAHQKSAAKVLSDVSLSCCFDVGDTEMTVVCLTFDWFFNQR